MTAAEVKLFWLLLSKLNCSGVLFTHIYEWNRHSPSSSSSNSFGWIFVVVIVAMSSALVIWFPLSYSESEFESWSNSFSLISSNNDFFEKHSSVLCQGILWNSQHFSVSSFFFSLPLFFTAWTICLEVGLPYSVPCYMS
jgi:hypothetical protein